MPELVRHSREKDSFFVRLESFAVEERVALHDVAGAGDDQCRTRHAENSASRSKDCVNRRTVAVEDYRVAAVVPRDDVGESQLAEIFQIGVERFTDLHAHCRGRYCIPLRDRVRYDRHGVTDFAEIAQVRVEDDWTLRAPPKWCAIVIDE